MNAALLTLTQSELETRLSEALTALHRLHMGERAVDVVYEDSIRTRFQEGDIKRLEAYIEDLRAALESLADNGRPRRRPIYLNF